MTLIAVANGALREAALVPPLGDHAARQVSTLILVALFAVYIGYITRRWPIGSAARRSALAPYLFFRLWRVVQR